MIGGSEAVAMQQVSHVGWAPTDARTYGKYDSPMSEATRKNIAIVAGIFVLCGLVAVGSFFIARSVGGSNEVEVTQTSLDTTIPENEPPAPVEEEPEDSVEATVAPQPTEPPQVPQTSTTTLPERQDFADLFAELRPAVASVDAVTCETTRQGTAFLINATTAITSSSVVEGAAEIAVTIDGKSIEASVLGEDSDLGIVALWLSETVENPTVLGLSPTASRVGDQVGAIIQPVEAPLSLVVGRVVSMDASNSAVPRLRTDGSAELGGDGGPVIDNRGRVVGVVDSGENARLSGVSAPQLSDTIEGWIASPELVAPTFCVGSVGLADIDSVAAELIATDTSHPQIASLQRTYAVYTQSINSSRATNAYGVLGPAITSNNTPEAWAAGQETSKLWDWRIRSVEETANGLSVRSVFSSTQDAEFAFDQASTCTRWDVTHDLVEGEFRGEPYWLINRSRASEGAGPVDCLDWVPEVFDRESLDADFVSAVRRTDRLVGGTVHDWSVTVDLESAEVSRTLLTVIVATDNGFEPVIELFDSSGALVAVGSAMVNDDPPSTEVEFTVPNTQVLDVRVSDAADTRGGQYDIRFLVTAA